MHKYEVGDVVKIVNKDLDSYGAMGRIVDIDEGWTFPYEIHFGEGVKFSEELFVQSDFIKADTNEGRSKSSKKEPIDFIDIKFQEGTVEENGVNGAQIEDVIDVLVDRLNSFQRGKLPCRENAFAVKHLEEAQNWLYRRTIERKKQGAEGRLKKHE